ncbi:DUF2252 family protein [Aurantimonas sp. VKM B-3413]|uniref:DUF2252 family protein n=1 Tax=Aurantimonas sp. VKM B-3413 TaxID=2779401 RepID=UPI001E32518C|nr:DUF2252 family protein [Aurantimonas sp. VKM B-3413]MCB8840052.1 DUF2252 domain-containing protein [Aurantimonas sp. VKM B-3413]
MTQIDKDRADRIAHELHRVDGARPGVGEPDRKHAKMAADPFHFFRGSAQLFYADLKEGTLSLPGPLVETVTPTAVIGDCHMANFGFMTEKGSHGSTIIFAPDDFDDACIGTAGWDLLRFLVSIFLAVDLSRGVVEGRYATEEVDDLSGLKAPSEAETLEAAHAFLKRYRKTSRKISRDPGKRREVLSSFPRHHVLCPTMKKARKRAIGGKKFETKSKLGKAVEATSEGLRFRNRPGRYKRLDAAMAAQIRSVFRPYVDDEILDIVERLGAGTGSVNVDRYYLLVGPKGASTVAELPMCHLVEVKQQRTAAPLAHFPDIDPRNTLEPAHLTVAVQQLVQREPDLLLDEVTWQGVQWLVRSRHHAKVSLEPEEVCLARKHSGRRLRQYVEACGEALALTHARADTRSTRFEVAVAAAVGQSAEALIETAEAYAGRTLADWGLLNHLHQAE